MSLLVGGRLVHLESLGDNDKVQWDWDRKAPAAVTPPEAAAFQELLSTSMTNSATVTVTGPIKMERGDLVIAVRLVET